MKIRIKPFLGGLTTLFVPSVADAMRCRNYPQVDAAYYYSVWMSHVCIANYFKSWDSPESVLEIGPGKSLGVGIAALLSGVQKYVAFDANPVLPPGTESHLVAELASYFQRKAPFVVSDPNFPTKAFPAELFAAERMSYFLSPEWLERIRFALREQNDLLSYLNDATTLEANSVDYLLSHSVLEHVDDLREMYALMWKCLRPGGYMTHSIDFSSHGTSSEWNGHWSVPDWMWRLMKGKRMYFINRAPLSMHQALLAESGFELKGMYTIKGKSGLTRDELNARFQHLSESDLTTASAFLIARKPLL